MAIITVDSLLDDGAGSSTTLREAIALASDGDRIVFSVAGTLTMIAGQFFIDAAVEIDGDLDDDGVADVTLDADGLDRVIEVAADASDHVTLDGLILTNGSAASGGGLRLSDGSLTLRNTVVANNTAILRGGGIDALGGALMLLDSRITGNSAGKGGGIYAAYGPVIADGGSIDGNTAADGAGLYTVAQARLQNLTVAGNVGGPALEARHHGPGLTLVNATVTGNVNEGVSSLAVEAGTGTALSIANSIVAGNGPVGAAQVSSGAIWSGVNLLDRATSRGAPDLVETDLAKIFEATVLHDPDGAPGSGDEFLGGAMTVEGGVGVARIRRGGPAENAADLAAAPTDPLDRDGDASTAETSPWDGRGDGFARVDGGALDIGALELVDHPPVFEGALAGGAASASVSEAAATGAAVFDVDANDGDGGATDAGLTYALLAPEDRDGDGVAAFAIDAATGEITVRDADEIDYEAKGSGAFFTAAADYVLDVRILDGGGKSATAQLTVSISDEAETFVVDTLDDALDGDVSAGALSLREAVAMSNVDTSNDDAIRFASGLAGTITLTQGTLRAMGTLDIDGDTDGDGEGDLTLDADGTGAVIEIWGAGASVVRALTLTGGRLGPPSTPGAVQTSGAGLAQTSAGGTLRLERATITGNETHGGWGGGLYVRGGAEVIESVISDNFARYAGGGIANFLGSLTVVGSTIAGNRTNGIGGGIFNRADGAGDGLWMANSTVARNVAAGSVYTGSGGVDDRAEGGGIYLAGENAVSRIYSSSIVGNFGEFNGGGIRDNARPISPASPDTLVLVNSLLAGNGSNGARNDLHADPIPSLGKTLPARFVGTNVLSQSYLPPGAGGYTVETSLASIFAGLSTMDPDGVAASGDEFLTGVLADNGGRVPTVAIKGGGAADDAGDAAHPPRTPTDLDGDGQLQLFSDARGPGFERQVGASIDVGAFERQAPSFVDDPDAGTVEDPLPVSEAAAVGVLVFDFQATAGLGGAPDEGVTYAFDPARLSGNADRDGDGIRAFALNAANGRLTVADPDDLDTDADHAGAGQPFDIYVVAQGPGPNPLSTARAALRVDAQDVPDVLVVDSLADVVDGDFGPGGFTLREALMVADRDPTTRDTITFAPGLAGGTITLDGTALYFDGLLDIDGDLDDDGAPDVTIDADDRSRVLNHFADDATLTGLRLTGGEVDGHGAGVFVNSGDLRLVNSEVVDNEIVAPTFSRSGAGLFVAGRLELVSSAVTGNVNGRGQGGGVWMGTGEIRDSRIADNSATVAGGGVVGWNVQIFGSTLSGNVASNGDGGGLWLTGGYGNRIEGSTLSGNYALRTLPTFAEGGALKIDGGALTIADSAVFGNFASDQGGGVHAVDAALTLSQATFARNGTGGEGGGLYAHGGGVTRVTDSTFTSNAAGGIGGGLYTRSTGGGFLDISNSIATGNDGGDLKIIAGAAATAFGGVNIFGPDSSGAKILGDAEDLAATPVETFRDVSQHQLVWTRAGFGTSPFIHGDLAGNGGPTQTVALRPDGVAVDAADRRPLDLTEFDGRGEGFERVVGAVSDIGAVEARAFAASGPSTPVFEAGTVSLTHAPSTLTLTRSYVDPVAIAFVASRFGEQPVAVRVVDVSGDELTLRLQEPDYLDGEHSIETVSYLVAEAGAWVLPDGTLFEAGSFLDGGVLPADGFESVAFVAGFAERPSVLSQVQGEAGPSFVVTRQQGDGPGGFEVAMQEEEAGDLAHAVERIGWIAFEQGKGAAGGVAWAAGSEAGVARGVATVALPAGFAGASTLAGFSSVEGLDPVWARGAGATGASFDVFAQEEQSLDAELGHAAQRLDWVSIDRPGAGAASVSGVAMRAVLETGETVIDDVGAVIDFLADYENPVIVAFVATANGRQEVNVRVSDVTSTSAHLRLQEPNYLDGKHVAETVRYVIGEAGSWALPNGAQVDVGTVRTNLTSPRGFEDIAFSRGFEARPSLLAQVQTDAGQDFVAARVRAVVADGFRMSMQEEEANLASGHAVETLGWIAVSPGEGGSDDFRWQAGGAPGVSHLVSSTTVGGIYPAGVRAVASLSSYAGADPAWARGAGTSGGAFEARVEEDRSADAEIGHAPETLDWFAFSRAGVIYGTDLDALL
ncbi:choice-of-anchor Q domain-containing protein [Albimonas sp. CAU 1670]|uniref:choice-of-anchor Q domain-containing protein n=1 Tax=Albimonas sp. CAU 1670 TaxID=3032599 RepID=UPI0023DB5110|nr:choice-of-anchor Q domain-containing protein [Albimonas sp. CAU 1670]MDF2235354.1 choice-of-anchor Q domain-containing protein [Albimonas sp. CAU 1670]